MRTIEYWRNPTAEEIKFGEGAIHYLSVPVTECVKKDNGVKKYIVINGLRYNCVGWYKGMSI